MEKPTKMNDFNPSLRNTSGSMWEASMNLPVVGKVTTIGSGFEEARIRLWLVSEAVKLLASKQCKDPTEWTEQEWRSTLGAMLEAMSPSPSYAKPAKSGYKLSPLETRVLELVNHLRLEDTRGIANRITTHKPGSVNSALLRLHKLGLIDIEHKGKSGQKGYPTVWSTKTNW